MWNVAVARAGGDARFSPSEMLLEWGDDPKPKPATVAKGKSVEELKMTARMWVALANADQEK